MSDYSIFIYPPSKINNPDVINNINKFGQKYSFNTLTDEHITKLILLQKINKKINRNTRILIYLHPDLDIDDFEYILHPKLFMILKYHYNDYNIFINKLS
jgi:hypothetical protein